MCSRSIRAWSTMWRSRSGAEVAAGPPPEVAAPAQLLGDGRDQLGHRLLALLQLAAGFALVRAQRLAGQRQELLVVALEGLDRQCAEAILVVRLLAFEPDLEQVALAAERCQLRQPRAHQRHGADRTDHDSEYQPLHEGTVLSTSGVLTDRAWKHASAVGRTLSRRLGMPLAAARGRGTACAGRARRAATSSSGRASASPPAPARGA